MKHFYIKIFLVLIFSFFSIPCIYSQSTVTTVINYSGFQACGGCAVCGADYWCTNTPGSYCGDTGPSMEMTFFDPVPAGNVVTSITVNYWTASCEGAAIYGTFANSSSEEFIMPVAYDGSSGCLCSDLPCMLTTSSSISFPCGIPGYVYGGNNIFKLVSGGPMCINRAEIIFTYWNVNVFTPSIQASTNSICVGESATLTVPDNGYTSYYWSTGATSQSITVSPANTTTYGVTVSTSTGCITANSSITITVNPTPTVTATASPSTICNGQCTNLTAGGASTYYWMPGTIPGSTYNVCPTSTTTYTVGGISAAGCSNSTSVSVNVSPNVTPTFNTVGPYCSGAAIPALPTTSTNGFTGTWSPAINNTATTTYTFTPNGGQCATTATMPITVNANVTPAFSALGPYCVGATPGTLTGTSSNGVSGTWSPATIGTGSAGTTTYTFTPTGGQCATTATMPVTVNANVTPTFSALGPYCLGEVPGTLSGTSTNGITGSWSPAAIGTGSAGTTTYTFTPSGGQCATTTNMPVTVNANITPAFSALGPYCQGATPGTLSGTSTNGISGTWSPATISTGSAGTTNYTFTPTGGQCAATTTMSIVTYGTITGSISGGSSPLCYNTSPGTFTATASGGETPYTYQWYTTTGIIPGATNSTYSPGNLTSSTEYYCSVSGGSCAPANTPTTNIVVYPELDATISGGTTPICDKTSPGTFTVTATGGTGIYTYQWYNAQGVISGATNNSYTQGVMVQSNAFYCRVTSGSCGWLFSDTTIIMVIPQVGNPTPIALSAGTDPVCQLTNGTTTTTYTTTAANNNGFVWSLSNPLAGTINPATGVMTWADGFYGTVDIQVIALGCGVPSPMITHTVTVSQTPSAEAGTHGTYTGIPIQIGDLSSGPGTYSWSPATGLNDASVSQPLATPLTTTTYTLTVNNNGCIATDTVTVTFGGLGHTISGKTLYAGRANAGNPVPNNPTYNPVVYSINKEIVILKNYPANDEVARDTSDINGDYQFTNVMDGNYSLSYDKYTADSMMWANDVNAIDVALMKYFIGSDTLQDPTRCFAAKYKKAANVDNNASINAVDVARIKAKIGAPYDVIRNFPRGNWVAMDKQVTVAGSDVNVNLETISYGDYNASSSKYRDSTILWSGAKSLPAGIIVTSEEYITTHNPSYFEIPLRISSKMNEFSALGLELNYSNSEYKLVSAYMPGISAKGLVKLNPSLEEILTEDNDLLVNENNGVIRVVYATTNHFDVAANDEMIVFGFRSLKKLEQGALEFDLSGTGVIANQFGDENDDAYLIMPKVFVQDNSADEQFEFSGYPNPFNGEASITYNLPENGLVTLKVYNVIGELVTELVNEAQESGKHSVIFSQKNLSTGLYTFKLEYTGLDRSKILILKLVH